jgi:hypothetical protein
MRLIQHPLPITQLADQDSGFFTSLQHLRDLAIYPSYPR